MALDFSSVKKDEERNRQERETEHARREQTFRRKVSIQQFMNYNGPLFHAFAKSGVPVNEIVEGEVLRAPAQQAHRLAVLVAANLGGKSPDDVSASEARPFRSEASSIVATAWLEGKAVDVERMAAEMASAARLADRSWDHDPYKDEGISSDASLMMTAAGVAGTLARQVEIYDFREGKEAALGRLVKEVAETASQAAWDMLGKDGTGADVRNLTQTLARNLCSIMEACYERKAREVVSRLNGLPEADKVAWYASHSPLDEVMASFRVWSNCLGGFAVVASQGMEPSRPREAEVLQG